MTKNCRKYVTPIEYHGNLPQRLKICLLRTFGNLPLYSTSHWPLGAAALLSLYFFS